MNWVWHKAGLGIKATLGILALIVSAGVPSGVYFFYKKNAWAEDVQASTQKVSSDARRSSNFIALDVVKLKIYRFNSLKEKQGGALTADQQSELEVLRVERRLLLEAIKAEQ